MPDEQAAEHLEVLPSGEDLVDRSELAGQPKQLANGRGLVHHVAPEDLGAPRVRSEQGREHADERGLPRSVRPEQSEDRPLRDVEVDTRERTRAGEALGHSLDVNCGRCVRHGQPWSLTAATHEGRPCGRPSWIALCVARP